MLKHPHYNYCNFKLSLVRFSHFYKKKIHRFCLFCLCLKLGRVWDNRSYRLEFSRTHNPVSTSDFTWGPLLSTSSHILPTNFYLRPSAAHNLVHFSDLVWGKKCSNQVAELKSECDALVVICKCAGVTRRLSHLCPIACYSWGLS